MKRKNAFTLIELLVVVAIIAVLVAILLPALARVRVMAKSTVCATNLKQIGMGYMAYTQDYHKFPMAYEPWTDQIVLYSMETSIAKELNKYIEQRYLVGENLQDYTAQQRSQMVWRCPFLEVAYTTMYWGREFYPRSYIFQTGLKNRLKYNGTLSPSKPEDEIGPLVADYIGWWIHTGGTWGGNHSGGGGIDGVEGLNQLYSDGHVKSHSVSELPQGVPVSGWMYFAGTGWPAFYWVEKP